MSTSAVSPRATSETVDLDRPRALARVPAAAHSQARSTALLFAIGLSVRLAFAFWGARNFTPTGDAAYYEALAHRLSRGLGYTWLWPDNAVTYVAHYPVGYPALLALFFAVFGARLSVAMIVNAVVGALAIAAAHRILLRNALPSKAFAGALLVAVHPALVAYTPALMTEGVVAALWIVAVYFGVRAVGLSPCVYARRANFIAMIFVTGVLVLIRPQNLILVPVLGWFSVNAGASLRKRCAAAVIAFSGAIACCVPWTLRNCVRMNQCALVSVNGGWNLLIGAQSSSGGWEPIVVPPACAQVWDEAAKDACFGREARRLIFRDPLRWIEKAPAKVAMTFDYFGAAPWYLHASNAGAFPPRAKFWLGAVETVVVRASLIAALLAVARSARRYRAGHYALGAGGIFFACIMHAYIAYLALAFTIALLGRERLQNESPVLPLTAAAILATVAVHAAFFGAGRYGLVVTPFIALLPFSFAPRSPRQVLP